MSRLLTFSTVLVGGLAACGGDDQPETSNGGYVVAGDATVIVGTGNDYETLVGVPDLGSSSTGFGAAIR